MQLGHNQTLLFLLLCWGLFREITSSATNLIAFRWFHIRDFYFPLRRILQLEALTQLTIYLPLLALALTLTSWSEPLAINPYGLLLSLLNLLLLAYATAGGLLILGAFYRDAFHLWNNVSMLLFWGLPILYPVSKIPVEYLSIFRANPLFVVFEQLSLSLAGAVEIQAASLFLFVVSFFLCVVFSMSVERIRNQVILQL